MPMPTPTPTELLTFLQEHGFLSPSQSKQFTGVKLTKYPDSKLLARELIDRKWLTAYQANQLLQGKGRDLILGPYRLVKRLGEGGMGKVFKARHIKMDRMVAVKIFPKELASNPQAVSRFYREARAVAKLSHPNIVAAHEVNQIGDTHYLAMEYVKGVDLARLVQQSGPLAIPQACKFIRQAAKGLQYAHEKRLVHRDIKPGNLMVSRPRIGHSPAIKVLDFGLSRFESESQQATRLTQLDQVVGTLDYIAPEQSQNSQMVDIRADIYSLGCSLFYVLTGNPPFPGADAAEKISARVRGDVPSIRKSRPEVSPALEQILAKMMARDPADRFQTPGEVVKELKPHCGEGTDTLHPTTPGMPDSAAKPIEASWSPLERLPLLEECGRKAGGSLASVDLELERQTQTLPVVNVELIAAKAPEDYPRTAEPAKRRRSLLSASIAFALCSIACLGLAILLYTASSDTQSAMPAQQISNSIAMKLAFVPAGKFLMGSDASNIERFKNEIPKTEILGWENIEGPQQEVQIFRGYYMGVFEVTQDQYEKIMGENPSANKESPDHPVEEVTLAEADAFCNKLSELPEERARGRVYRLPTEEEWEYACRAGTTTAYHWGNHLSPKQANVNTKKTVKVGSFRANTWGLFDMHGNVWEWCMDGTRSYTSASAENGKGPRMKSQQAGLRGGSFLDVAGVCRSALRNPRETSLRGANVGFRVVCDTSR